MRSSLTIAILLAFMSSANASSDEAWAELQEEVSAACLGAAAAAIEAPEIVVDPYGSERFGLALVSGRAKGAEVRITQICVFDKQTKAVELGSELDDEALDGLN